MTERRNQQNPSSHQQRQGSDSARQQQQFDTGAGQQGGGGSGFGSIADQIARHMDVVDQNGAHVGTVDHVDGDRIKLTRGSSGDGEHHYLPLSQVAAIEGNKVRLTGRGDASFGQEAGT